MKSNNEKFLLYRLMYDIVVVVVSEVKSLLCIELDITVYPRYLIGFEHAGSFCQISSQSC